MVDLRAEHHQKRAARSDRVVECFENACRTVLDRTDGPERGMYHERRAWLDPDGPQIVHEALR